MGAEVYPERPRGEPEVAAQVHSPPARVGDMGCDGRTAAGRAPARDPADDEVGRRRPARAHREVDGDADPAHLVDREALVDPAMRDLLCPDDAVALPGRGVPRNLDRGGHHGGGVWRHRETLTAQPYPRRQLAARLASGADERPVSDAGRIRVDRDMSGRRVLVLHEHPAVDDRARRQVVDDVPQAAGIVRLGHRDIDEPDADPRLPWLWRWVPWSGERAR